MLKKDDKFTPRPVADGDVLFPNGFFAFHITKINEHIQKNPGTFPLEEVAVGDFFKALVLQAFPWVTPTYSGRLKRLVMPDPG